MAAEIFNHTQMKNFLPIAMALFVAIIFWACESAPTTEAALAQPAAFTIQKNNFGSTAKGEKIEKYQLANRQGTIVEIITYGGIITRWTAADRAGKMENVVLGFDSLAHYLAPNPYFGALIGRYGNRIAKGQFAIDQQTYQLETNDGSNHLHGGEQGFDKVVWTAKDTITEKGATLRLSYLSKDGEGGYPGNLQTTVSYTLTTDNALVVDYEARTDQPTIVNLTQHTYFNLSADFSQSIEDHELRIPAAYYLPVDATLIPTGEMAPVADTPFDFNTPKAIGQDITVTNEQLARGKGYDHCWVLPNTEGLRLVATAVHPASGRKLVITSDEPGIQFYSGNFLDGTLPRPSGGTYLHRSGFCLETQHYPDSPNRPEFPSVLLLPGQIYHSTTTFTFTTTK